MRVTSYAAAVVLMGALAVCGASTPGGGPVTAPPGTALSESAGAAATSASAPVAPTAENGAPTSASPVTTPSVVPGTAAPTSEPGTAFSAWGLEVRWRAVIENGVLSTEGSVVGTRRIEVERRAFVRGVDFTGRDGSTEVTLTVKTGSCIDDSGKDTTMQATLSVGDRQLQGCAVEGAVPVAGT